MKRTASFFAFFLGTLTFIQAQSRVLDVKSFDAKMASVKDKTILDVRTPDEYSQGHLTSAVMVDYNKPDFKQQLTKLDKAKPVFVYCAAGVRSAGASKALIELGFTQVYDLQGGINAWKKAQMPIVK
ncbi:MAG: rhodanese-like domain-containing protein [Cyclobacteriaceae bacterium]|nr:rhodanese-like domain-containing protein [Cyclobacteriaceae bacterium]